MRRYKVGPWHVVGAAGEPVYINSYTAYGGAYPGARFRKDADGLVTLSGLVQNAFTFGGASGIFVLPASFLPVGYGASSAGPIFMQYLFLSSSGATIGRVDVWSDGTVALNQAVGSSIAYLSLDGMSFYAS